MEPHDRPGTAEPSIVHAAVETSLPGPDLAPPDVFDPVVEAYKKDIDRTLLVSNLRCSVAERLENFQRFMNSLEAMRGAALQPEMRKRLLRDP